MWGFLNGGPRLYSTQLTSFKDQTSVRFSSQCERATVHTSDVLRVTAQASGGSAQDAASWLRVHVFLCHEEQSPMTNQRSVPPAP
eukprot:27255-Prymnesium_polylepis.1